MICALQSAILRLIGDLPCVVTHEHDVLWRRKGKAVVVTPSAALLFVSSTD
jgi:hypothetical protein